MIFETERLYLREMEQTCWEQFVFSRGVHFRIFPQNFARNLGQKI